MSENLELAQFKEIFLSESKENLQVLNQSLVMLEKEPGDKEKINAIFRVAHTLKGMAATMGYEKIAELTHLMEDVLDKIRKDEIRVRTEIVDVLFDCLDALEKLINAIESSDSRESINLSPLLTKLQEIREEKTPVSVPQDGREEKKSDEKTAAVDTLVKQPKTASANIETIRVNVRHIDTLMNLVGEMVINKGRLEEISGRYRITELEEALSIFDRIATDLQSAVLKTRMVPVSHIFDRFPRMVRDIAKTLGKQVQLEMTGTDIEIDRILLEQINEPLVHILRNAIDHGLESSEERVRAGKPEQGKIMLSARREQSAVVIEVRDDGRGMSAAKLKEHAIEKNILTKEAAQNLSDKDAFFLICDPRFSTAKAVTDISGRGVGMDVVKFAIESVNGLLQIDSKENEGSVFSLKLPLSLAIISVLLIQVQSEIYAIPLSNIVEIVAIKESEIKTVDKKEVIVLRDEIVPLVRLARVLQVPSLQTSGPGNGDSHNHEVVIVQTRENKVGFVVSKFIGRKEVVLKTLTGIAKQSRGFSGATILGDGRVVLILDVEAWM